MCVRACVCMHVCVHVVFLSCSGDTRTLVCKYLLRSLCSEMTTLVISFLTNPSEDTIALLSGNTDTQKVSWFKITLTSFTVSIYRYGLN